jgi:hypothetical protein
VQLLRENLGDKSENSGQGRGFCDKMKSSSNCIIFSLGLNQYSGVYTVQIRVGFNPNTM